MDLKSLEGKNFYEVLGVPPDATTEQIKEVYRDLARVYHPDSNFYSEIVPEKVSGEQVQLFKVLTAAYNTLIDIGKRKEYDETIAPLLSLGKRVRGWEDDNAEFRDLRKSSDPRMPPTARVRRMSGVFGRTEFTSQVENPSDQEEDSEEERAPQPKQFSLNSFHLMAGLGLIVGVLAGGAFYYLFLMKHF